MDGNCPARQNFLHPMTQPMCRGRMGSPAPLGSSAAFWEHHSPGLRGFFWKMSPACDESVEPLCSLPTASCEAWGCPHGHLPAALCAQIFLLREERLLQELSRGLGLAGLGLASWSPRDRQTERQTDTSVLQHPRRGLQLGSVAEAFPLLRASSEPGSKGCAPE